jgi:transglutaminase-like putative cysteine protease
VRLSRGLRVTNFKLDLDADVTPIKATGRVLGDSILEYSISGVPGQKPDTQRVRLSGPILLPTLLPVAIALGEHPKVGKTYTLPIFDVSSMSPKDIRIAVDAESLFVLQDSSVYDPITARWSGALPDTVRAWKLRTVTDASSTRGFTGWIDEQGRVVRATQALGMTLERRPYEVAFENWKADRQKAGNSVTADQDIYESTAIGANKRLRSNLQELKVRLTGVDLSTFDVKGYRQRLRQDTLIITRETPEALAGTYNLPDGAKGTVMAVFLDAEPLLEVDNADIKALALRLHAGETNPRVVAERINTWVYDSIAQVITVGVPSAANTLRTRRGDCNEHTQLFVALARAAGIPARIAAGLAYVDGKFYYHAWPEIWLERFVAVDPTFGEFPADASHIRFTIGGLGKQAELLRLMGTLHIDVLSSR